MKYIKAECGIWHNGRSVKVETAQDFNDLFSAKYHSTYLQEERFMRRVMRPRVEIIKKLVGPGKKRLVDIGTAYGTFLTCLPQEWQGCGFEPVGEIATHAYNLGRMVFKGSSTVHLCPCQIVTMWNVIEHISDLWGTMANIERNLEPGGILGICTPNASGGFFRYRRDLYEAQDDPSHIWVFEPKSLKKLVEGYGFKVVKTVITGHHPSRWGGSMFRSKLFGLGDTFEIYARRTQ
jgi:hypothetical protein